MCLVAKSYLLPLMSFPHYEYNFLPQVFHYGQTPTNTTMHQIQVGAVHTANLMHTISYFQSSMDAPTEEEETRERGAIFRQTVEIFSRVNHPREGQPNAPNSP